MSLPFSKQNQQKLARLVLDSLKGPSKHLQFGWWRKKTFLVPKLFFFSKCFLQYIWLRETNPSCLWSMVWKGILWRNIIWFCWCLVRVGAAARTSTTHAVCFKIYWSSKKFYLPLEHILDQTKFGHKDLSTC